MNPLGRKVPAAGAWILLSSALLTFPARAQMDWTADPGNPVIPNTLTGGYALVPSVLYDSASGLYRMWFTAHPYGGPWAIFYALSQDGIHWFSYAKNPVLTGGSMPFEASGVVYAGVVYDDTQYRMYYTGLQGCCGSAVGLATSPDGIIWTKYPGNPVLSPAASGWDSGNIGASTGVCYDGLTYYLLYQGVGSPTAHQTDTEASIARLTIDGGSSQQIGLATSTDGVTFTKSASNPVIPRGGSGDWDEAGVFPGGVFVHDGVFYAFYAGAPSDLSRESLGLATSSNGSTWIKDARNPVFGGGSSWDWNIGSGTAVLRDGTIQLWYAGNSDGGNEWSIGYATAPFDGSTATLASLVSAEADPTGVHIVWGTTATERVTVFRRLETASWIALDTKDVVAGRVRFDDPQVEPGMRYAYSIGRLADARELLATETWIDVPARPVLQLRGAQPNPAPGAVTASFVLPTRGRVSLELFDLAGRRVLQRKDLDLNPGSHLLPLILEGRAAPGVYLLRMSFKGHVLESRVVVAR